MYCRLVNSLKGIVIYSNSSLNISSSQYQFPFALGLATITFIFSMPAFAGMPVPPPPDLQKFRLETKVTAVSPDLKYIAKGRSVKTKPNIYSGEFEVWTVSSRSKLLEFKNIDEGILNLQFSQDASNLTVYSFIREGKSFKNFQRILDLKSQKWISPKVLLPGNKYPRTSKCGRYSITTGKIEGGTSAKIVRLKDKSLTEIKMFNEHGRVVTYKPSTYTFSQDGKQIAFSSFCYQINTKHDHFNDIGVFDLETGKCYWKKRTKHHLSSWSFSPDNKQLLLASFNEITSVNAKTGEQLWITKVRCNRPVFSKDGKLIAVCSQWKSKDGLNHRLGLKLLDAKTGKVKKSFSNPLMYLTPAPIYFVEGNKKIGGLFNNRIKSSLRIFDLATGKLSLEWNMKHKQLPVKKKPTIPKEISVTSLQELRKELTKSAWSNKSNTRNAFNFSTSKNYDFRPDGTFSWSHFSDHNEGGGRGTWKLEKTSSGGGIIKLSNGENWYFQLLKDGSLKLLGLRLFPSQRSTQSTSSDRRFNHRYQYTNPLPKRIANSKWKKTTDFNAFMMPLEIQFVDNGTYKAVYEKGAVASGHWSIRGNNLYLVCQDASGKFRTKKNELSMSNKIELKDDLLIMRGEAYFNPNDKKSKSNQGILWSRYDSYSKLKVNLKLLKPYITAGKPIKCRIELQNKSSRPLNIDSFQIIFQAMKPTETGHSMVGDKKMLVKLEPGIIPIGDSKSIETDFVVPGKNGDEVLIEFQVPPIDKEESREYSFKKWYIVRLH